MKKRLQESTQLMIKHLDLDSVNERALHNFLKELESASNSNDIVQLVDEAIYFTQKNK
ncbi:hypothetical protein J8281_06315 [Aquimarina sp. U1-2]|uniref:hypothetical protein n=1 Tax=Aquimarina sp. U1-2 TaxID=2823141 RepID=UPI001AEC7345|nr:hypothetical protein [Aquimarina sp. U1-2]MBP2831798.1 hypothetical protein [Aquimarina sp. U1-2]